jgi:ribose 5-phosphate isomerase A
VDEAVETYRQQAAKRAVEFVEPGMVVGLGHGSTALFAVRRIAELLERGILTDIVGVPCSKSVEAEAERLGIPLTDLENHPVVDLTIDGADEVDPELNLIKGGGGALLREKIVAQASDREIVVVDEAKLSPVLGTLWPVPIEVLRFGWRPELDFLSSLGAHADLRLWDHDTPFESDQGNFILDANFGPIDDPYALAASLDARAAIVGHGLFLGLASDVVVAGPEGLRMLRSTASDR